MVVDVDNQTVFETKDLSFMSIKYGIITHYDVLNHGAMLQLNAMIKVLNAHHIDAQALQFEKNYDFMDRKLKSKYKVGIGSIFIYLKFLKERGLRNFLFLYKKTKLQNRFKTEQNLIGPFYSECGDLDGVVIGSDEVFALHTGPTPVFFGHALPSKKVFAYAGCFGPTTYEDVEKKNCRAFVESGLKSMSGLAMRDQNSIEIAESLTGIKPELVCDPVILYGYEKEIAVGVRPLKEKYMVIYAYDQRMNETKEVEAIRVFAKKRNLKIVSPGFYHGWVDKNVNPSYDNILSWFKYAEYVVTDTFHGAVMSLITNREMAVKVRDNGNKLVNLLNEYGLADRLIDESWSLDNIFAKPIDWIYTNKQIEERRQKSLDYLKRMIEK